MKVGLPFSEWVGPRLSGLVFGPSFSRWGCWPFLFGVGVGISFFGWELVLSFFGVGFLPSRDGELALLSRGWFFFFSGGWPFLLALPSCCQLSSFLLGIGVGPSR